MIQVALEEDLLSIGDVARELGVATHTLRFWEKEFDFYLSPTRTEGRQRRYGDDDMDRLERIHALLKVDGYSIAGAKRFLRREQQGFVPSFRSSLVGAFS